MMIYLSYVKEAPGVRIRHARRRRPANTIRGVRVLRRRPAPHQPANRGGCGERDTAANTDSLEEMEARLMSRAARMLISRATVLPGACVCCMVRRGETHQV